MKPNIFFIHFTWRYQTSRMISDRNRLIFVPFDHSMLHQNFTFLSLFSCVIFERASCCLKINRGFLHDRQPFKPALFREGSVVSQIFTDHAFSLLLYQQRMERIFWSFHLLIYKRNEWTLKLISIADRYCTLPTFPLVLQVLIVARIFLLHISWLDILVIFVLLVKILHAFLKIRQSYFPTWKHSLNKCLCTEIYDII